MKKYGAKLTAGLLTFAMTASSLTPAFAAPANTEESTEGSSEVVLSQTAQDNIAAIRSMASLGNMMESTENDVQEDTPESKLKDTIKDWIFNGFDGSLDLSRFSITSEEMDAATAEVLDETGMESAADVTYETDDEGQVTTAEVEMDPMVVMAAEELETVYNLTEEQTQELLGMYAQYLQLCEENADMFGVQVPYNTTRDTNASPIGSLLDIASIPEEYIQAGYVGYDDLFGIVQLYYLGTQFAVSEYKDEVIAGRNEALSVLEDDMTEMQTYLALNDWLANNCQFAMDSIMKEMVEPEPAENPLYTYAYNCMYDMIKQQAYDGAYDALKDVYGEEQAEAIATQQAESYMVDVQEEGGSGEQMAASYASMIVGMWGSNQIGVFVGHKAVCFGYANVYAYLLQCAHPEIYLKDGATDIDTAENWKSYKELNYELDSDGNPVKDEDGNYKWSKDSAAIADYVKIIFDAKDVTMFGQNSPFGEAHYWNAVKLDGKWYYVDPCYVDIYIECMNRDRVETDGNLNHLYFMFSDTSCREMYKDNFKEIRTLYENIATDQTYEEAWVAFVKSQPYKVGDKIYYLYDSTDLLDIMRNYGNGSSSSSRAADDGSITDYEGLFSDTEYKIAYHDNASMSDSSDEFGTLIDFNNGQVYNPTSGAMEDNAALAELYEEHQAYVEEYPSISISCAYYNDKIYFSLSNCILSYDLKTGAVEKLIEYTEVSGKRDMSNGLGGLAFTMTSGNPGTNGITVENPPIADMTIKADGKMYVSVATNYAFISGKDFGQLTDYSSYGYQFAETNYEPSYNSYYNNSEENDNDEFMWSANIVGTIDMSHLAGGSHSYKNVTVPASCTEDEYTVSRCSDCGRLQDTTMVTDTAETVDAAETKEGYAILEIEIKENVDGEQTTVSNDVIEVAREENSQETEYIFQSEEIKAKAQEMISQKEGYTLDDYEFEDVPVEYGKVETVTLTATKEAEQATATLSIEIKDGTGEDAQLLQSGTLTAEGVKGEPHTFAATEIQAKAEGLELPENYVLDTYDYKDVNVAYGATETVSLTASKVQATATLSIEIKDGTGEDAQLLKSGTLTADGVKDEKHTFVAADIKAKAEEVAQELPENYVLDAYEYTDVDVTYGATETVSLTAANKEPEQATATLSIEIKDGTGEDAQLLQSGTLTADGVKDEKHTFAAADIKAKAEEVAQELSDNYVLDTYEYTDVDVAYGSEETVSLTASKVQATATLSIEIKDGTGEDAQLLQSGTLTAEGAKGDPHTFKAADIQAKAEGLELPENYVLDAYEYKDVDVTYGATETVSLTASKEKATATLNITVYDSATVGAENEEDKIILLETKAEKEGPKDDTYAFTADDIKTAIGEIEGYTLDEDSLPTENISVVYGGEAGTVDVTATEIPTGAGHTYIKFNETYYTKDNSDNWQTGTSYVCIDCGHAFELEDDETVEDHLRSNDKVLTDDEVKSYAGKTTKVWTWSTDKTEASMYTVPTDLKDHKFDCIWENPSLSSREVATVSGDCTTGKFTAKLSNGETSSASVEAGNHTYNTLEDPNTETQEASVQWTWDKKCTTATATFTCDVCGKTLEKTVKQADMESSETEDGLIKYTATVTVDEVKYISSREYNPNPFEDVSKDDYYYDAVLWAVENNITVGKDETHFAPSAACTRAQVVTFLWRTMDEPEPETTENPFVDVTEDDYYYKAVLWASENGITVGKDDTHFAPGATVTRAQFVAFLHRNEGEPKPETTENPFVDVSESDYYYNAVLWAYENGITVGKDETHFAPKSSCTRAQVVTFLYRAYGDEE